MRSLAALFMAFSGFAAAPLAAQEVAYEYVEYEVAGTSPAQFDGGSERYLATMPAPIPAGIAAYGPFRVVDDSRAALVDVTDSGSPAAFAQMLADFPRIAVIEMVDCPGTEDDRSNLQLGRMIRERSIATWVPSGGSVRSGAVELFLAGSKRFADPGAEFAVHAWMDEDGREATDYAAGASENRKYLDYYRQMGMSEAESAAFYAMTNSVPHARAKWFGAAEMARWVRLDGREG